MGFRDSQIVRPVWPFALNHNSPQAQGLVAWWPIVHPGGRSLIEMTGRNQPAAAINLPQYSQIEGMTAFYPVENGVAAYFSIPDVLGANFTEATMTCWIQRTNNTQSGAPCHYTSDAQNSHYPFSSGASGEAYSNTLRSNRVSASVSNLDKPHLLTITTKPGANGWRWYQNLSLILSQTGDNSQTLVSTRILGSNNATQLFPAWIADFRIYNRFLAEADIAALYDRSTRYNLYWELGRRVTFIPPFDQTIEPGLLTQSISVPSPTVAPGAVTIAPDPVSQGVGVAQPTVAPGAVTIAPDPVSQGVGVAQPTVAPGAVTIAPDPVSQGVGVAQPTVAPGAVTIAPDPVSQGVGVAQPTVAPGAVALAPNVITQAAPVFNPTLSESAKRPLAIDDRTIAPLISDDRTIEVD